MDETSSSEATGEDTKKMEWYVLKVQSNREKSIKTSLERRIKRENMEDYFGEIVIPTQKIRETKSGKTRVSEQKLFPGYMMIQMELNDETWYLVRDTTGVGDFTGAAGKPIPMRPDEVKSMLGKDEKGEKIPEAEPINKINLTVGEMVKIKEGSMEGFEGTIDAIDQTTGEITVLLEFLGRTIPVKVEHWQAEKV
jgi:transcriptional antiterminator NusG